MANKKLDATISWDVKTVDGDQFLSGTCTYHGVSQADFTDIQTMALESDFVKTLQAKAKAKAAGK